MLPWEGNELNETGQQRDSKQVYNWQICKEYFQSSTYRGFIA